MTPHECGRMRGVRGITPPMDRDKLQCAADSAYTTGQLQKTRKRARAVAAKPLSDLLLLAVNVCRTKPACIRRAIAHSKEAGISQ